MLQSCLKKVLLRAADRSSQTRDVSLQPIRLSLVKYKGQSYASDGKYSVAVEMCSGINQESIIATKYEFKISKDEHGDQNAVLFIQNATSTSELNYGLMSSDLNDDIVIKACLQNLKHVRMLKKAAKVSMSIPQLGKKTDPTHKCNLEADLEQDCSDQFLNSQEVEQSENDTLSMKMKRIMKIASPIKEITNKNLNLNQDRSDSVLYMGLVFAVLCPKKSISSKFRGYDLKPSEQIFKVLRCQSDLKLPQLICSQSDNDTTYQSLSQIQTSQEARRCSDLVSTLLNKGTGDLFGFQYWRLLNSEDQLPQSKRKRRELKQSYKLHSLLSKCDYKYKPFKDNQIDESYSSWKIDSIKRFVQWERAYQVRQTMSMQLSTGETVLQQLRILLTADHDYRIRLVTLVKKRSENNSEVSSSQEQSQRQI